MKDKKFNIEDEGESEFGMGSVGEPKKYVPNKVEEGQCENEVIIN